MNKIEDNQKTTEQILEDLISGKTIKDYESIQDLKKTVQGVLDENHID
jgi:hypothetical protein